MPRELRVHERQADPVDRLALVGVLPGMRPAVLTSWLVRWGTEHVSRTFSCGLSPSPCCQQCLAVSLVGTFLSMVLSDHLFLLLSEAIH